MKNPIRQNRAPVQSSSHGRYRPLGWLLITALLSAFLIVPAVADMVISEYEEDGLPVVIKFNDTVPPSKMRKTLRWHTSITWSYDGSARNGMPSDKEMKQMFDLEAAIGCNDPSSDFCRQAFSRTGNNLKELVYYIADREEFMRRFNQALHGHPVYPIDIVFYEDPKWREMKPVLSLFDS